MNILPKKSWHVRTRANIERVRRDEAQAAEEAKEIERRKALAESEARTEILRNRARKRKHEDDEDSHERMAPPARHINFFSTEEEGIRKTGGNAEYEAEKKAEKEKQEKAIGLLTYLGQSSVELQNEKPWYFKPPEKRRKCEDIQESSSLLKKKEEFDLKHKWGEDPMKKIIQYLDTREKVLERDKGIISQKTAHRISNDVSQMVLPSVGNTSVSRLPSLPSANNKETKHQKKKKKKEHHKKKKHKHEKKKKKRKHSDSSDDSPGKELSMAVAKPSVTSCGKSLQELRAERLRREREERMKREQLLAKLHGDAPREEEQVHDERAQRYNSQYNPELVRKKKTKPNIVEV